MQQAARLGQQGENEAASSQRAGGRNVQVTVAGAAAAALPMLPTTHTRAGRDGMARGGWPLQRGVSSRLPSRAIAVADRVLVRHDCMRPPRARIFTTVYTVYMNIGVSGAERRLVPCFASHDDVGLLRLRGQPRVSSARAHEMSLYGEPDTAEAPADGTLVVPDYAAAPAGSSGPTSMGSEPQSSAARQPGSIIPFEKLGRRAEVIGPAYLCCIVGLGIMAALVIAFEPDTTVDPESQLDSFSDGFWFVWVTFHSCTYGDIVPKTDAGRAIAAACSGTGYLFFIFVCLTTFIASQQPSGTPAVVLRSSAIQGVFKFMPAYGCVVIG
eukprot:COSAG06_NODE_15919_length_1035_cov_0.997863_1_plen_325_part_01